MRVININDKIYNICFSFSILKQTKYDGYDIITNIRLKTFQLYNM